MYFNQTNAAPVIHPAQDRSVGSLREFNQKSWFAIVVWREARCLKCGFLKVSPVVIGGNRCAVDIVKIQGRVLEEVSNSKITQ